MISNIVIVIFFYHFVPHKHQTILIHYTRSITLSVTFDYFRAPSCQSVIEIVDGEWSNMPSSNYNPDKQLMKLCSPAERLARDESGKFVDHRTMVSRGPTLTLVLRRSAHPPSHSNKNPDTEFLDGAYTFHDGK